MVHPSKEPLPCSDLWQVDETTDQPCSPPSFVCSQKQEIDHQTGLWELESQKESIDQRKISPVQDCPNKCFPYGSNPRQLRSEEGKLLVERCLGLSFRVMGDTERMTRDSSLELNDWQLFRVLRLVTFLRETGIQMKTLDHLPGLLGASNRNLASCLFP